MIEIRIHGRGGQGAVTTASLLAIAAFHDNKFSQAFPSFGPERGGSPVIALARIDNEKINLRSNVYEPDVLIVLDPSLVKDVDVTKGLKKNGIIIINSQKKIKINNFKTYSIDATSAALEITGKPIVNTALLGAFSKITNIISLNAFENAIEEYFQNKKEIIEPNKKLIKNVYEKS